MKLLYTEPEILSKYKTFKNSYNGVVPPQSELSKFVYDNLAGGNELEEWVPTDFVDGPPIIDRFKHTEFLTWVLAINRFWPALGRKVKDDVKDHPEMYSTIWVPNGFIMPGGRFGELYYWDTYWIIKGLLLCDMKETAKGIINNIVYLVDKFGFMPNGGRIYYVNRSQPPMLIQMASSYYKFTNDLNYISSVITVSSNNHIQIRKIVQW
jgi:alpha,alpha-trehalase